MNRSAVVTIRGCKTAEDMFERFAEQVIPDTVSRDSVQWREMRKAFLSGIMSIILWLMENTSEELTEEADAKDAEKLEAILREVTLSLLGESARMGVN